MMDAATVSKGKTVSFMNRVRMAQFRAHVEQGGKCFVDLGCGCGDFSMKLAIKSQQWVLGIDENSPLSHLENMDIREYSEAQKFVFFTSRYADFLSGFKEHDWLCGAASELFMIMPYPRNDMIDEMNIITRILDRDGIVNVRSEKRDVLQKVNLLLPWEIEALPFRTDAARISSSMTKLMRLQTNDPVYQMGFKALLSGPAQPRQRPEISELLRSPPVYLGI